MGEYIEQIACKLSRLMGRMEEKYEHQNTITKDEMLKMITEANE